MPPPVLIATWTVVAAAFTTLVLVRVVHDDVMTARHEAVAFLVAVLGYGVFYAAFFLPSLRSGNFIAPSDSFDFGVADYLSSQAVWTAGMWSGYPVMADPQALTWYPVMRLFRALGIDWNIFLIAAYVIASSTCFLFVRRLTRSTLAGVFSGFVCGFNALAIGYITNFNQIHAFAWVPLMLYGLQLIREGLHRRGVAVAATGVAMMWLAGHPQVPVYGMYLAAAFVAGYLLLDRTTRSVAVRQLLSAAGAMVLGLSLAAITLLPMIELASHSPRSDSSWQLYISSALPPRELLTLVAPFAFGGFWTESGGVPYLGETGDSGYVGLLPLALAAAASLVLTRHRREARLWVGLAGLELLLSLGAATPLGTLFFYAPGYAGFQAPLRHLFLVSLCLAVTSGLAISAMTNGRERPATVSACIAAATAIGLAGFAILAWWTPQVRALAEDQASYARWARAWPLVPGVAGALIALVSTRLPKGRAAAVALGVLFVAAEVADLTAVHYRLPGRRFEYADIVRAEAVLHPKMIGLRNELERTSQRVLATDGSKNQFLLPNLTRAWNIPAASGTGSLPIERYLDVVGMDTSGAVSTQALSTVDHGIDLFGIRYALVRQDSDLAKDLQHQADRWQPVENLSYYESDPDTFYTLFRNGRALPRAWCVPHVIHVSPPEAVSAIRANRLPGGGAFDPSTTALLESEVPAGWTDDASHVTGEVVVDPVADQHRYLVNARTPCMLVIGEVSYPWWRASIDDTGVDLHTVDHAMLGVAVPPGAHVVRLELKPVSVWIGGAVSGLSLLIWGWVLARSSRDVRRGAQTALAVNVE